MTIQKIFDKALAMNGGRHQAPKNFYWAQSTRNEWIEIVPSTLRQCEVNANCGDTALCRLAARDNITLAHDEKCHICSRR